MEINNAYMTFRFVNLLKCLFNTSVTSEISIEEENVVCINRPFKCCILQDFLQPIHLLNQLKNEALSLKFSKMDNDLYHFNQSIDLKKTDLPCIKMFVTFLHETFLNWMMQITEFVLDANIDVTVSCYKYSDYLLCHDDRLDKRKVAFILYLNEDWSYEDGGTFDMFDISETKQPKKIVKSFIPQFNQLIFFEVSEIIAKTKMRICIAGWFHSSVNENNLVWSHQLTDCIHRAINIEENGLYVWFNPIYLNEKMQKQIKKQFENTSEIQLEKFFHPKKFEEVSNAFSCLSVEDWDIVGPANQRKYEICKEKSLSGVLKDLWNVMISEAFCLFLSSLTGLSFENRNSGFCCTVEFQKWQHGNYTLMHDNMKLEYILDVFLFFNSKHWKQNMGGHMVYVTNDNNEELLTIVPQDNSLSLIYRDQNTLQFVKYINHNIKEVNESYTFYKIFATYSE